MRYFGSILITLILFTASVALASEKKGCAEIKAILAGNLSSETRKVTEVLSASLGCITDKKPQQRISAKLNFAPNVNNRLQPLDPREIVKKLFPSTVIIFVHDKDNQPLAQGSGFVIDDELIATNFHVIEGAAGGYVKFVGDDRKHEIGGVTGYDQKIDIAVLRVRGINAGKVTFQSKHEIGQRVYAIGNPLGLEGTFSAGIVSGLRTEEKVRYVQITAPISPGSSGGPVVDDQANVIGIATAGFDEGQNLNFAVPSEYLRSIAANVEKITPLASIKSEAPKKSKRVSGDLKEAVKIGGFNALLNGDEIWKYRADGHLHEYIDVFSFSIRNLTNNSIENIHFILIIRDKAGNPIDLIPGKYSKIIPAKLARRARVPVAGEVAFMSSASFGKFNIEARVLDFSFAN